MRNRRHALVLSIYLNARGFAFVLFESSLSPYDWGIQIVRGIGKRTRCLLKIVALLDQYQPDVLVLQDTLRSSAERAWRLMKLNAEINELGEERGIPVYAYSRDDVYQAFQQYNASNKQDMAELIARHVPAFERYVPPPRKPWMSEDARMGLFDAAALGLIFFLRETGTEL